MSGWSSRAVPSGRPRSAESAPASGSRPAPGAASERAAQSEPNGRARLPVARAEPWARRNDRTMPSERPACSPHRRVSPPRPRRWRPEDGGSPLQAAASTSPQARSTSPQARGAVKCVGRDATRATHSSGRLVRARSDCDSRRVCTDRAEAGRSGRPRRSSLSTASATWSRGASLSASAPDGSPPPAGRPRTRRGPGENAGRSRRRRARRPAGTRPRRRRDAHA